MRKLRTGAKWGHDVEALAPGGFTKPRLTFSTEQPGSHTRDKTPSPSRASKSPEPKSAGRKPLWLPPGRATTPESNTVRKNTKTDGINRKPLAHLSGNTKPIGRATTPSKVTTAVEPQFPADVLKAQREALRKLLDQTPSKKARASVPVAVPAPAHPRVKVLRKEEQ
ncbi:hypothetical protein EJ06DRAFT_585778 [Trichodelitschia bisporula]|uniref:Uncharacterized protein n=1 Tax=Trichodelitschia bisporula TaxID=703511 RepID=A0A6G1HIA1_9PEZI|nr:hypothetical protein EJ06DRAFT_585778 [Trichodelitschia bisporula]